MPQQGPTFRGIGKMQLSCTRGVLCVRNPNVLRVERLLPLSLSYSLYQFL